MFNKPLRTVQQAKEYFRFMGCSHFHMVREYPQRYEEYMQLNISTQIEIEWRKEQLNEYYMNVIKDEEDKELWIIHSNMADLVESIKVANTLKRMLDVTHHIKNRVPYKDRVIISETINGRKDRRYRSGLIYLAYDLKDIPAAKDFIELSRHFSTYSRGKEQDLDRCQRATKLCNDIKKELNI